MFRDSVGGASTTTTTTTTSLAPRCSVMKRKRKSGAGHHVDKRQKLETPVSCPSQPLFKRYYPEVVTLRQFLASRLSKKARRRLQQYGRASRSAVHADVGVVDLLDNTQVGSFQPVNIDDSSFVEEDLTCYTQQLTASDSTVSLTPGLVKQNEIIDFAVWILFRRHTGSGRPKHILCQNFQRYITEHNRGVSPEVVPGIPGVYSTGVNEHVEKLRLHPWNVLPDLLGDVAARVMTDLLVNHAIFTSVANSSNMVQLSGVPMSELELIHVPAAPATKPQASLETDPPRAPPRRGLSEIRFVRSRVLYARPVGTASGEIRFGLTPVHALNRYRIVDDFEQTSHIIKYIFPAQFGLHNVLGSSVTSLNTAQPFKDYTLREQEIGRQRQLRIAKLRQGGRQHDGTRTTLPRRLRGMLSRLIHSLRKRHSTCAYDALLEHYCPRPARDRMNGQSSMQQASSTSRVSAFCRAVVRKVLPLDLWGIGEVRAHNIGVLHRNVDLFVHLRRYETLSLHNVLQSMKLAEIQWLAPEHAVQSQKLSRNDFAKRCELMAELLYWTFDSFLIPLIRSNFYVTESNVERNHLFYFRHDAWKHISGPALASLRIAMLEEQDPAVVRNTMKTRSLGVSYVRLLPKENGMRPIINLRRRTQKIYRGQTVLGRSVNSMLKPTFAVLNFEKQANPGLLGSALFSVDDIFPRLQGYRHSLQQRGQLGGRLYFGKVDVQACFDTIPQKRLLQLVDTIMNVNEYHVTKYSRAKLLGSHNIHTPGFGAKPSWKFLTKASAGRTPFDFDAEVAADTAEGRSRTTYINGVVQRRERRNELLDLLSEHIGMNLMKMGRRFYRQKEGIPQGSTLSSLLCSYFYAELEREVLGFVHDGNSVLLRLIDDFMIISTNRDTVVRFMQTMHAGVSQFGVNVKLDKSRANFDIEIDGLQVPTISNDTLFPYCGMAINTATLDIGKDEERRQKSNIADSVTIEYSKLPGQSFYRRTLNALRLQMHAMLLSTSYNSIETVLSNLFHSFTEVAQKNYHYVRLLPPEKRPSDRLIIRALDDAIKLACVLMRRRKCTSKDVLTYHCSVTNTQARWLACSAFIAVFRRRQTRHRQLLHWLQEQVLGLRVNGHERKLLGRATGSAVQG